jgi:hypothetical protein
MKIEIGSKIRYSSAAGVLTAVVDNIVLDLNAANQTIPWLDLAIIKVGEKIVPMRKGTRLCANDNYLKMMKVEVL